MEPRPRHALTRSVDLTELEHRTRVVVAEHPDRDEAGAPPPMFDRELSWLAFNERVLSIAARRDWPVLERAKFLAIFATNMDEFFQVRVAGIMEQVRSQTSPFPGRLPPARQLAAILPEVHRLVDLQARLFLTEILRALAERGISFVHNDDLTDADRQWLDGEFESTIFPVLTPLAVDPAHPFPYLSNLSLNLAVLLRAPGEDAQRFARVKIPPILPRFVGLPDGVRFVPLEQVVAGRLDRLFPGLEITEQHVFRVTRNADLTVDGDDVDDLLDAIETELSRRRRGQQAVRLEVEPTISDGVLELLVDEMGLASDHVIRVPGPLDLSGLWTLVAGGRPPLTFPTFNRVTPPSLDVATPAKFFAAIAEKDVFIQHPYDDFDTTVLRFIEHAADDPDVLTIKLTLYRTSGDSPIVKALVRAATAGKQVVVLVELKARFDEATNIRWARRLEEVGVHVAYGVVGLKTHTKVALVVRREATRVRRYCHVGTGNYHDRTARIYEDVGVLTADPAVGADLTDLFNVLTGYGRHGSYRRIVTAPTWLRERILELIAEEAAQADGHVVMKMNSLVDSAVIESLYEASQRGTRIDLIVRGICCLRPGVPGLSDNIRVRSIVGRYLEHSRIYRFGSPARGSTHLIGSGDMMPRNLDMRVEAFVPVTDPDAKTRLDEILDVSQRDDVLAWDLRRDGTWHRPETVIGVDTHLVLEEAARLRANA